MNGTGNSEDISAKSVPHGEEQVYYQEIERNPDDAGPILVKAIRVGGCGYYEISILLNGVTIKVRLLETAEALDLGRALIRAAEAGSDAWGIVDDQ